MFVLIYPFTSQIFYISNDTMQRFTYNEKTRDDLLQYNGINFRSRKNGSNFAKSENPNDSLPTENLLLWIDLFRLTLSERYAASVIFTRRQQ